MQIDWRCDRQRRSSNPQTQLFALRLRPLHDPQFLTPDLRPYHGSTSTRTDSGRPRVPQRGSALGRARRAEAESRRGHRPGRGAHGAGHRRAGDRSAGRTVGHAGRQSGGDEHPAQGAGTRSQTMAEHLQDHADLAEGRRPDGGDGRPAEPRGPRRPAQLPGLRRPRRGLQRCTTSKRPSPGTTPTSRTASKTSSASSERRSGRASREATRARIDLGGDEEMADAAPIRKLLNMVLLLAIKDQASDIHFEPFEDEFKIRVQARRRAVRNGPAAAAPGQRHRHPHQGHGEPRHRRTPPAAGRPHRTERRRQPGRPARQRAADDVRRIGRHAGARPHRRAARPQQDRHGRRTCSARFREVIKRPNGIVLVTGPTGSGKTTTLYSALNELNDIETKIITTEDPVEYDIDGIDPGADQPRHRRDLRHRAAGHPAARPGHDPGRRDPRLRDGRDRRAERRSPGTWCSARCTPTTPPSAITRLRDMGVEPFLITATVEAILAQRLVRKICVECRTRVRAERRTADGTATADRAGPASTSSTTARAASGATTRATRAAPGFTSCST